MSPGPSPLPRTTALLSEGVTKGLHLGSQLYVSLQGAVIADVAGGESRSDVAMTPDTLIAWLSSGKPVGAVAIAQLWQRGKLGLDDRVSMVIPEFAAGGKEAITIRHLLTHTGGFRMPDVGWPGEEWSAIITRVCRARIEPGWEPGHKAGYHQASSWFILGEILRRLDGRPFETYVRQEILEPLGLKDSWIGMPRERYLEYAGRLAKMYDTTTSPPSDQGWDSERHLTRCSPAGGAWGPMRELGRFYEMLLGGGELDGVHILSPQTVEAMTARQRAGMMDHTFHKVMDWGLGFIPNPAIYQRGGETEMPYAYGRHASRRAVGHSGYRSSTAFMDPEYGLVVALAVNGTPTDEQHMKRFAALTEAIYEDLKLV